MAGSGTEGGTGLCGLCPLARDRPWSLACACASPCPVLSCPVLPCSGLSCGDPTHRPCPFVSLAAQPKKRAGTGCASPGPGGAKPNKQQRGRKEENTKFGGTRRLRVELHEYYPLMPSVVLYLFCLVHGVASNRLQPKPRGHQGRLTCCHDSFFALRKTSILLPPKWRWLSHCAVETGGVERNKRLVCVGWGIDATANSNEEQKSNSSTSAMLSQYCWYPSSTC